MPGIVGTGVGIFWIDWLLKPGCKSIIKEHPEIFVLMLVFLYSAIAYKCVKSAWQSERD